MDKDQVRTTLERIAAAAGDRARQRGSRLLGRWVRLHNQGAGSWFLLIDTPATVHDDTSRGDTSLDIACAVDAPLDRTLAALDDPGKLLDFLNDPETDIRHPLDAAMVYELLHPGGIDRQLRALLGDVPQDTPAPTVEAAFDDILQRAGRAISRRYPRITVSFNFDIAGLGTRSLQVLDGAPVVNEEPLDKAKCEIRMDRAVLEAALADPITAVAALVEGDLEVSNACRARQLAMSLWHDTLERLLPLDLYVSVYDPAAMELATGGVDHQTYILVDGEARKIVFTDIDGEGVVEGDIVIGRTEELLDIARRVDRQTAGPKLEGLVRRDWGDPSRYLWPNGTLYYTIDDSVEDTGRIADAIAMFSDVNLTFVEGEGDGDYVLIKQTAHNKSTVGRVGGEQVLQISAAASAGVVAHELCHALGLHHEHSRYDRDEWVEIIEDNVENWDRRQRNFNQKFPSVNQYVVIDPVWDSWPQPPSGPKDKDRWIVRPAARGGWKGHDNEIAEWDAAAGQWTFTVPAVNSLVRRLRSNRAAVWDGTAWELVTTRSQDFGTYDYGSIMHYPSTAFGRKKNSSKTETTIKALRPRQGKVMGQRRELSQGDKETLNALYATESLDALPS